MFQHNLKLAFRNFKKDKNTFLINLIGLSTSLACTLLIAMWVLDEYSFDQFHENKGQLYQVMENENKNLNDISTWSSVPMNVATALEAEMPEVVLTTRITRLGGTAIIANAEKRFKVRERYVGKDFFEVFTFPLLDGQKDQVLVDKNSVVISEETALKLFQTTENLIGKTIKWERNWNNISGDYQIAGVFKNLPTNSTLQFDVLFNYQKFFDNKPNLASWKNSGGQTFLVVKEGTNITNFNTKIEDLIKRNLPESKSTLFVRPFADTYLYGNYENGEQAGGRITYVRLFSLVALFILLIACINFMNLATAKANSRMKEVGVKKAIGANRTSLIGQYLGESTLITMISFVLALSIVNICLPYFNDLTNKTLSLSFNPSLILAGLGITIFTGLVAGSYPALYLSALKPVEVFKGKLTQGWRQFFLRKGLVVFQFALSIILIVSVLVVYNQIQFIQHKNLGFNKDNVILFDKEGEIDKNMETFLTEIKGIPGVVNASNMDGNLVGNYGYTTSIRWPGDDQENNPIRFGEIIVGKDWMETMGIELLEGKDFMDASVPLGGYIMNEKAIETMGLEDPVGKTIIRSGNPHLIVGIMKNFHLESLYEDIRPCYIRQGNYGRRIVVKIANGKEQAAITQIEDFYGKYNPGLPFEYRFLDDDFHALYAAEQRVADLAYYFAGMAVLISCLGLFGLATFTAQRRRKEIGIRKVLGASVLGITRMLSGDFAKMVLTAIFISLPISYFIAKNWLDSFAYRVDLQLWFFIIAGFSALFIALLTVSFQTVRAARGNPVDCLKME